MLPVKVNSFGIGYVPSSQLCKSFSSFEAGSTEADASGVFVGVGVAVGDSTGDGVADGVSD